MCDSGHTKRDITCEIRAGASHSRSEPAARTITPGGEVRRKERWSESEGKRERKSKIVGVAAYETGGTEERD